MIIEIYYYHIVTYVEERIVMAQKFDQAEETFNARSKIYYKKSRFTIIGPFFT